MMSDAAAAAVAIAVPVGLGALVGFLTSKSTKSDWYAGLKKPSWQPPSKVIGPVWTVLYAMMGVASYLAFKSGADMSAYAIQLLLNLFWSVAFFSMQNLELAVVDIVALVAAILVTIQVFQEKSGIAAALMVPYLAWTCFAMALTIRIAQLNKPPGASSDH